MIYFLTAVNLISVGLFVYKIFEESINEYVSAKTTKLKNLRKLVASQHDNKLVINAICCSMIIKANYLALLQYLNTSVYKTGKNVYEVSYVIEGKPYTMIVNPLRGPCPFTSITNDLGHDITPIILPYLGPRSDWHRGTVVSNCPKEIFQVFNTTSLTFNLSDGTNIIAKNS